MRIVAVAPHAIIVSSQLYTIGAGSAAAYLGPRSLECRPAGRAGDPAAAAAGARWARSDGTGDRRPRGTTMAMEQYRLNRDGLHTAIDDLFVAYLQDRWATRA